MPIPKAWLLLPACVALAACAQDPEVTAMVPPPPRARPTASDKIVAIFRAQGGEDTNLFVWPSLGDAGFRKALQIALERSGLFKAVVLDQNGDYVLYPEVLTQDLIPGLKTSAVLQTRYRLVDSYTQKKLWEERILSVYDADLGEGLYGLSRARAALEGAVRKNLKTLIERLAKRLVALKGSHQ